MINSTRFSSLCYQWVSLTDLVRPIAFKSNLSFIGDWTLEDQTASRDNTNLLGICVNSSCLQISCNVTFHQQVDPVLDSVIDESFDELLPTDIVITPCLIEWTGTLSVALHPSYQVPCAYMRLINHCGEIACPKIMNELLQTPSSVSEGAKEEDIPIWIEDEHPMSGDRCLTLHICGISERMNLLTGKHHPMNDETYLLKWFSFIGPYIGICWKPDIFECLRAKLETL